MVRQAPRTQPCTKRDARVRLGQARKFLEVADLAASDDEISASASVAAALAVLAGIAASDAACCSALGLRPRGQDHRQAVEIVREIEPGGPDAARALARLLDHKDAAQYGLTDVAAQTRAALLRRAQRLVEFAERVLHR